MLGRNGLFNKFTVAELDRELLVRGARVPDGERFVFSDIEGTPERDAIMKQVEAVYDVAEEMAPNEALSGLSDAELIQKLVSLTYEQKNPRGVWGSDERLDVWQIQDGLVLENVGCVASIWESSHLFAGEEGMLELDVKNFGRSYNLNVNEPFRHQPVSRGKLCTGFLVAEDIIATAGHCVNSHNLSALRIVFGYRMMDAWTPLTRVSADDVYQCVDIVRKEYQRDGKRSDWALVKLDRAVKGRPAARLVDGDIARHQPIYVVGHPCGLPLKYAPGASVHRVHDGYFVADLDVYSGNSGSPVFDRESGEVIGLVARGDNRDFRWTGQGLLSVRYPNMGIFSEGAHCTRVSEFRALVADMKRKAFTNGQGC